MKRIDKETFIRSNGYEETYAIRVKNGKISILANIESAGNALDGMRVEVYGQWKLDEHLLICGNAKEYSGTVLSQAVQAARDEHCGGIYFEHEKEDDSEPVNEVLLQYVIPVAKDDWNIFVMSNNEFINFHDVLTDGDYIIYILE